MDGIVMRKYKICGGGGRVHGYIKIDRKMLDWEWYKNEHTKNVFLHCLLKANWKDGKFQGRIIPRGAFITSVKKLSLELDLTEDEVKTALKHLIKTGELTKQTTNKYTVITVSNYVLYQEVTNQNQNSYQSDTKQMQNNSTSITNLLPTIEEYKEEEESKKEKKERTEEYKRIVEYLNRKCGTRYRYQTSNTQKSIHARFADGYTEDDFYTVIDKKCAEWMGTEHEKYLRPETLFGTKFEAYLNQKIIKESRSQQGERDILDEWRNS